MTVDDAPDARERAIARAVALLREALMSERLTPYAEPRIRAAIIALGKSP